MIDLVTTPPSTDEEIVQRVRDEWGNSKGMTVTQLIELTIKLKNEMLERQRSAS